MASPYKIDMERVFDNTHNLIQLAIEQGKLPRYVYKYRGLKETKMILQRGTIYFSKLSQFNDPFEGKALLDHNYTLQDWIKFFTKNGYSATDARHMANDCLNNPNACNIVEEAINHVLDNMGYFCLAKKPDNLLMWSHYTNEHKGCVVEFDLLQCLPIIEKVFAVIYDNNYITYNYLRADDGPLRSIIHKSIDWSYEEEYRIINKEVGVVDIPDNAITSIILGCRMLQRNKTTIKNLVLKSKFNTITLKQAQLNPSSYKLDIVQL